MLTFFCKSVGVDPSKLEARRAATVARIKETARALLVVWGADGLSLREVARQMGQSSSALYRYFANRDELLTALIVDAYDDLGLAAETAEEGVARFDLFARFMATCTAVRTWAQANPHLYALLYGSPVPGYQAPETTVAPASRVPLVFGRIVGDAGAAGLLPTGTMSAQQAEQVRAQGLMEWEVLRAVMPQVPDESIVRAILAWSTIFGYVSFELFGHFEGSVIDTSATFHWMAVDIAGQFGLRSE